VNLIAGSCHCGNIRYDFWSAMLPEELSVRACQCSFCKKHGGRYSSDANGKLEVRIQNEHRVNKYRFATETADFWICKDCGLLPLVTTVTSGKMYGVVNLTTADDIDASLLAGKPVDTSLEDKTSKEERRRRTWTPAILLS